MNRTEIMDEHQKTFDRVIHQMEVIDLALEAYNKPYINTNSSKKLWKIYLREKRKLEDLQFKCRALDERLMKHVPLTIKMTYNNQKP